MKTLGTETMYRSKVRPRRILPGGVLMVILAIVMAMCIGYLIRSLVSDSMNGVLKALVAEQRLTIEYQDTLLQAAGAGVVVAGSTHDLGCVPCQRDRTPIQAPAVRPSQPMTVAQTPSDGALKTVTASWYGPGLYGNTTASGAVLTPSTWGVAHKTYDFGTMLDIYYNGRVARVPVIDRGPFTGGRSLDLTAAVAQHLGFTGVQTVRYCVVQGGTQ